MAPDQDTKSALKLAQFKKAVSEGWHIDIIEKILDKEGDINYAIPLDSLVRHSKPSLLGCTALHFTCMNSNNVALLNALLNCGADFTKTNEIGETALHKCITFIRGELKFVKESFIEVLLSAHVDTNNFSNPSNKYGLSHFHIACIKNDSRVVEFFLKNGISVDEPVGMGSNIYPGYTPLHLAVMNAHTKIAEILVAYGANIYITDTRQMTLIVQEIERRIEMFNVISNASYKKGDSREKLQKEIVENEKIINIFMENISSDNECSDSIGLSNFHIACVLQDTSAVEQLIDQVIDLDHCVTLDSPLFPGYTALHFAAHVSLDTVEMLVNEKAKLATADSKWKTPLDICIENYKIEDVVKIMSLDVNIKDILFSDGQTNLLSFIRLFANTNQFKRLLQHSMVNINMIIPIGSALWSGYTPLHLAVQFAPNKSSKKNRNESDLEIIKLCLKYGSDLSAQDVRGQTALHLAFRLGKMRIVDVILGHYRQISNVRDDENLTHLHIACATNKRMLNLNKFVLNNEEVNARYKGTSPVNIVRPGSTPLHISIVNTVDKKDLCNVIKILLSHNADVCIQDDYGLTPVHWLPHLFGNGCDDLIKHATRDCVAEKYGYSHLHVACHQNLPDVAKRFLDNGANVNLAIRYTKLGDNDPLSFLSKYDKYTPLSFLKFSSSNVQSLLMNYGADVFAKESDGSTILEKHTLIRREFISRVWNNVDLQAHMEREFGWTKLHLACYFLPEDKFKGIVEAESRIINARVFSNSPIWKGYTPLHMLIIYQTRSSPGIFEILLEKGADVTIVDDQQNTPIGMMSNELYRDYDYTVRDIAAMLTGYQRDFSVNPINDQGISHFHMACYLNVVAAVQGFLSHGNVDVNDSIDVFSKWHPGCTPLHLASQLQVVDLLLNHGADIHAENLEGRTVIQNAVKPDLFDENVIVKIIQSGADVNKPNLKGETPFEIAISTNKLTIENLQFYIRQGFHVNSCNPITGKEIINENCTSTLNRTTLHNCVTEAYPLISIDEYIALFEKFIQSGQKFENLDGKGQTVLHLAVKFGNEKGVRALLMSGVDINFLDANGMTALAYESTLRVANNSSSESIQNIIIIHACRLNFLNLYLNRSNLDAVTNVNQSLRNQAANNNFYDQVDLTKEIELVPKSVCLYDLLSETGVISSYNLLKEEDRKAIDRYFEMFNNEDRLKTIRGILKLQYKKAIKRMELISPSTSSFKFLLGFNLPDLCIENLFRYLGNSDLEKIISAAMENEDIEMDVD